MPEIEHTRSGKRRIFIPDTAHQQGAVLTPEQQRVADLTFQLQQVESATHQLVTAINRGSHATLSEYNLTAAIAVAHRVFNEYTMQKKRTSSIDEDIVEEYMQVLEQAEEAFAEHQTGGGKRTTPFVADRWKPQEKTVDQLRRLNLTMEQPVPKWMVTMVADALGKEQLMSLVHNPELIRRFIEDFDATDPGLARAEKGAVLHKLELLGAARLLPADPHEHHAKEVHDVRHANALRCAERAAEEWESVVPACAKKYEALHARTPSLIELVGRYYEFTSGKEFDTLFAISHIDISNMLRPETPTHNTIDAIGVRLREANILLRVLNEVYADGTERRGAETRLWRVVQDLRQLLNVLQRTDGVDGATGDHHRSAYIHVIGKCEQVLNAIDARERATLYGGQHEMELDDVIDVNAEEIVDVEIAEIEHDAVEQICTNNELHIPLYVQDYVAAAYYSMIYETDEKEENQRIDDAYEYIVSEEKTPLVRRVVFRDILPGMIRRAGLELQKDYTDKEGNVHRAKQVLQQLIDEWELAYPPVAEKYRMLQQHWDEMLDVVMNLDVHYPIIERTGATKQ